MCGFFVGVRIAIGFCCDKAIGFLDFFRDLRLGVFCFRSTRALEMYLPVVEVFPLGV